MAAVALIILRQLLRERHGDEGVAPVAQPGHHGSVLTAGAWGSAEVVLDVPDARTGSHEDLRHCALGEPSVLDPTGPERSGPWLSARLGHRAIGVVYQPGREVQSYVPTCLGGRYDALLWSEGTAALRPLHHELRPCEPELASEPSGFSR